MRHLAGLRTFVFAIVALAFLVAGLQLCLIYPTAGIVIFGAFAGAVVFIVAAVAGKSAVGKLADGGGVKGAWSVLTTSTTPGSPSPSTPPSAKPPEVP